jgi:hypothetical protein
MKLTLSSAEVQMHIHLPKQPCPHVYWLKPGKFYTFHYNCYRKYVTNKKGLPKSTFTLKKVWIYPIVICYYIPQSTRHKSYALHWNSDIYIGFSCCIAYRRRMLYTTRGNIMKRWPINITYIITETDNLHHWL